MSGSKSVSKTARAQETKRLRNRVLRGRTRTLLKQVRQSIAAGEADSMQAATSAAGSAVDRAVTKGVFHKNKAARLKSRLARQANSRAASDQAA